MTQETELELELDGVELSNEQDPSSTEIEIEEDDDNTSSQESKKSPKDKNESNFKALYKSNKEKEKALAEKDALIAQQARELEEWKSLNPEYSTRTTDDKSERMELKIFGLENPEAKAHLDEIRTTAQEYGLPFERAWKLVKAELPTESRSTSDFDFRSAPVKVKKSIKDISADEALKLSPENQAKWRKFHLGVE